MVCAFIIFAPTKFGTVGRQGVGVAVAEGVELGIGVGVGVNVAVGVALGVGVAVGVGVRVAVAVAVGVGVGVGVAVADDCTPWSGAFPEKSSATPSPAVHEIGEDTVIVLVS